jgi:hypothetical protein
VLIDFVADEGIYTGTSRSGRRWRNSRVLVGWRLEFRNHERPWPLHTRACVRRSDPVTTLCRSTLGAEPGFAECDGKEGLAQAFVTSHGRDPGRPGVDCG